jgi:predicted RNA-binding protein YlqC (UPF0109 family)
MSHSVRDVEALMVRVARSLVDDESAVQITAETVGTQTFLRLKVAAEDVGKLIGKQGRTARSLRAVLVAISVSQGFQYSLDITES